MGGYPGLQMSANDQEPVERRRGDPAAAPARRATIQDVAREAGVSFSAVSKVVRGAYGVSPQMRERVEAAIERLNYRRMRAPGPCEDARSRSA